MKTLPNRTIQHYCSHKTKEISQGTQKQKAQLLAAAAVSSNDLNFQVLISSLPLSLRKKKLLYFILCFLPKQKDTQVVEGRTLQKKTI